MEIDVQQISLCVREVPTNADDLNDYAKKYNTTLSDLRSLTGMRRKEHGLGWLDQ